MLTLLEGYMVISPSRPDLCPVDPPLLGGSVRYRLSLPHPGTHPRMGRGRPRHRFPHFHNPISEIQNPCPIPPPIKAHRASSRQTRNIPWHPASRPGTAPSVSIRVHLRSNSPFAFWRLARFPLPIVGIREPRPIPPAINPHQGISRHPQKTPVPLDAWSLEVGIWSFPAPSPLRLCDSASLRQNPGIKPR